MLSNRAFIFCFLLAFIVSINAFKTKLIKKETPVQKLIREGHHSLAKKFMNQGRKNSARSDRLLHNKQPLTDFGEYSYTISIGIGTPVQQFSVYVSMSMGDFWVGHKSCISLPNNCDEDCHGICHAFGCMGCCDLDESPCAMKHKFDNDTSTTYNRTDYEKSWFPYNEGAIPLEGFYAQDVVTLGDGSDAISIPDTNLELATLADPGIIDPQYADGVIGLTFRPVSTDNMTTVLENAVKQGLFDKPVFNIWIDNSVEGLGVKGQISFGELDDENCNLDSVPYIPLLRKSYWEIQFDDVLFNGYPLANQDSYTAIFDLNLHDIIMPYDQMLNITKQLDADYDFNTGTYIVDCSTDFTWTISVQDQNFVLNAKNLIYKGSQGECHLPFDTNWGNYWTDFVFGESFLKSYCGIFDLGGAQIGLASLK